MSNLPIDWLIAGYLGFNVGCVFTVASHHWHTEQQWRLRRRDLGAAFLTLCIPLPLINLAAILWKRRQALR